MDLAALIVGVIGTIASVVSVVLTIVLTTSTNRIKKDLKTKFSTTLSINHFNEAKKDYAIMLNEIRNSIQTNPSIEIGFEEWSNLDLTLTKIRTDLSEVKDTNVDNIKLVINNVLDCLSNSESPVESKNKTIISSLNAIIAFLESYKHVGG